MPYQWFLFAAAAFLMGSFPSGKIIAWLIARIDITKKGSGNIGATNVARELGIKWGLVTLALDISKGLIPVLISHQFFRENEAAVLYIGLFALMGHQFSIFQKFKGGKGVATALGVYFGLSFISLISCVIALIVFVITVYKWDFISLGSMVASLAIPILLIIFGKPWPIFTGSFCMAALIIFKHRDNIRRLVEGKERKWKARNDQEKSSSSLSNSSSE